MDPNVFKNPEAAEKALFGTLRENVKKTNQYHDDNDIRDKHGNKTALSVTDNDIKDKHGNKTALSVTDNEGTTYTVNNSCKFEKEAIYSRLCRGLTFGIYSLTVINEDQEHDYEFQLKKKQSELGDDIQDPGGLILPLSLLKSAELGVEVMTSKPLFTYN